MAGARGRSPQATSGGRVAALVVTALAITTVIGTELTIIRRHFEARPEVDLSGWAVGICLAGVVSIVVAAWMVRTPRAAVGMAIAALGALLPIWSGWAWMPASVRVAVLAVPPLVIAGVVRVVTATPAARLVDALAGGAVLVHLAGYNAFADGDCTRTCADVRPLASAWLSTRSAVVLFTALTVGAGLVAAIVVARRSTASRLTALAALAAICGVALGAIARWTAFGDLDSPSELLVLVPLGSAVLVAAATCVTGARTVRTRVEVRRLVDRLSGSPNSVSHVPPVRSVRFAMPDGRWVDMDGRAVDDPPTDGLVINDESGPAVRLVMAGRTDPTDVVAALTPATRLALRNAQLSAIARARVADVQASRRRVVAASDGERQRIERDLHDGAQQRLVSASLHLRAAIGRADPPGAAALTRADATTRAALARLRDISHGIFPSVLTTEGLGAALEGRVGASSVTVTGDIEVDAETAMAAYATVAAALDARSEVDSTAAAEVSVVRLDGTMTVTVTSGGPAAESFDFTDIADRVGAARGELTVTSDADRTTVTAVLPCGS